jgi:hypothetical protein
VTQSEVADARGLPTVHDNRVLKQLCAEELIVTQGNEVRVLGWGASRRRASLRQPVYIFAPVPRTGEADSLLMRSNHQPLPACGTKVRTKDWV